MLEIKDCFLKCDLHIHSSSCYSRSYSKEFFINKLAENKLDVISITDHNIIDVDLYNEIIGNEDIKSSIIGGIELNISLSEDEIERYHLTVKKDYFHGIIWYDKTNLSEMWKSIKKYMKDNIPELQNIDSMNLNEISNIMKGKSLKLDKLQNYIKDINYYFIFHENKGDRNLSDYLDNTENNEKYKEKLFYYNNHLGLDGNKKNKKVANYFEKNLNTIVSSFLFSDAKQIDEIGIKFSWINFDGSFKNLILPISDPESRIKTSDEAVDNPQKNKGNYLESIKFNIIKKTDKKDEDGNIISESEGKIIYFSPGLNGIIGSRGSGKTLLGNILGNVELDKYKEFIDTASIQYKLKDSEYMKDNPKCKYLHQNRLMDIYESGDYMELDFIKSYYDELLKSSKEQISKTIAKIKNLLDEDCLNINNFVNKYNNGYKQCDILLNKPKSNTSIKDIDEYNLPDNITEKDLILQKNSVIEEEIDNLSSTLDEIKFTKKYDESEIIYVKVEEYKKNQQKLINELIESNKTFVDFINNYDFSDIKKRKAYIKDFKDSCSEINSKNNNDAKVYIDNYKELLEFYTEFYMLRKQINENNIKTKELYNSLFNDNLSKDLTLENGEKINISSTLEEQDDYDTFLNSQFKNYSNYLSQLTSIVINANDEEKFKTFFSGQKFKSVKGIRAHIDKLYDNIKKYYDDFSNINLKIKYKNKDLKNYSPGKKSELLLEIFLCGDIINNDKYKYIILDQPEDNLDTNTIIIKLVKKIRKMKLDKQLFVISHSAPIIVNADSDIIICSKEDENSNINYLSGRINDKVMKQLIVDTLDGGEKNLKMRLNKYDFNYEEEL